MKGQIEIFKFKSKVLENNPLKDPHERDLIIYLPERYHKSYSKGYTAIFLLPSFGNNNYSTVNNNPFSPPIYQILENLIEEKKCEEMIIVILDCFNKFGGSQYVNSSAVGNYKDYLVDEIVPFINSKYNVSKNALLGKSSGGYGAITIGMQHPKTFSAIAAHSFDSAFEYCYLPDFPIAYKTLKKYGNIEKWLSNFWNKEDKSNKNDFITLNIISMAAHYSPRHPNTNNLEIEMPFDLETGEFNDKVWSRWKSKDPINMIDKFKDNLKNIDLLFFDCGINDEFNLLIGTKIFSEKCKRFEIDHDYMQYEGGHFNTSYRYRESLSKISEKLSD